MRDHSSYGSLGENKLLGRTQYGYILDIKNIPLSTRRYDNSKTTNHAVSIAYADLNCLADWKAALKRPAFVVRSRPFFRTAEMPSLPICRLPGTNPVSVSALAIRRQMKRNSGNFGPIPSARPASDQDAKRAMRERYRQTKRLKGE